jgi:DNA-directed RNA polymerase specialized sigma24 family protein
LTANNARAEAAVTRAIELWDQEGQRDEALVHIAMRQALQSGTTCPHLLESHGILLPAELQAVSNLPSGLRRCLVLRVLAGLSFEDCAELLRVSPLEVSQSVREALMLLPVAAS